MVVAATIFLCGVLSCCLSPRAALAAEGKEPGQKVAAKRFEDWELICGRAASAENPTAGHGTADRDPGQDCKIVQRLAVKETGQSVFLMTVLQTGRKDQSVAIVSTPLGGYLAPGMLLTIDGGRPFKVLFETCNAAGCHGGFELAGRVAREFQQGKSLKVRLWTDKSKPADVGVSLSGFRTALAALKASRP